MLFFCGIAARLHGVCEAIMRREALAALKAAEGRYAGRFVCRMREPGQELGRDARYMDLIVRFGNSGAKGILSRRDGLSR